VSKRLKTHHYNKFWAKIYGWYIFVWDVLLFFLNQILGKKAPYMKHISKYVPPSETDSRGPCPALNSLSNHGVLPRNGRDITYDQLYNSIQDVYNFSPSFTAFTLNYWAKLAGKDWSRDTVNLSDFSMHNGIEHDASLTREDAYLQQDQSKPSQSLIDRLLSSATGDRGKILTADDLSVFSSIRRAECRSNNDQFSLSFLHKVFGSSNASTLLIIFGGIVEDLTIFLKEERIPNGWATKETSRFGLTQFAFNKTVFHVEMGIDETAYYQHKKNC